VHVSDESWRSDSRKISPKPEVPEEWRHTPFLTFVLIRWLVSIRSATCQQPHRARMIDGQVIDGRRFNIKYKILDLIGEWNINVDLRPFRSYFFFSPFFFEDWIISFMNVSPSYFWNFFSMWIVIRRSRQSSQDLRICLVDWLNYRPIKLGIMIETIMKRGSRLNL